MGEPLPPLRRRTKFDALYDHHHHHHINTLPAHYRAREPSMMRRVHPAGLEQIDGLHTPLRTLWRNLRHAGFLTVIPNCS
ncbi:jg26525 [Pararge aegeria aegeria]|uniref:Jg26525 protein n=1 Tax=Pararge aegeria aegeria TaxID=348720 RepID=A0A8S4QQG3_9NEOP|nr:jg26525 [Pararge aegeria aegeria]